ncbi:PKD domain-containing protein [Polluticaenibacter yanchengensis]|uniref:PKD domain-containing protein n=1 Tax=Polluticaenibacter yanchengensis TaxID=3014562 RepID=A0ABT4UES0_9BACT|nr:PKD domain-containing protein [Chitinophagaceae bacterium LY-5]
MAQKKSNKGKEFWTGYGHNQFFTTNQGGGETMVLYLSAEEPATVTVSINGTGFTRTYNIPANTAIATEPMPRGLGGGDDARLYSQGKYDKGIHIVSDTPIVAYAHVYGQTSSGSTMLLPVETFGYNYYSVNTEQNYASDAYSWFFVVASENNTRIRITPSQNTFGINRNQAFEVDLQKGEIYNVLGRIQTGTFGFDLTGSYIKSIEGADGKCHPVGVFSGSSRTSICANAWASGDFIIQQVFPSEAWGTEYLTAPTSSTVNATNLNRNRFRVTVKDRTTIVYRNGVRLTGLVNNFYYEYASDEADYITANKPIMVSQIMVSEGGCGNTGRGDPDMFYISSVPQAVKRTIFYNTNKEGITHNFVTIIVPNGGLSSLKIDGGTSFSHQYVHPNNNKYTVVVKSLPASQMQHIVECDSGFTAVTYGMGTAESYGYNAGTFINDLDTKIDFVNTSDKYSVDYTCAGTTFFPQVKTMYNPTSITWHFSRVEHLNFDRDTTVTDLSSVEVITENGRTYNQYTYKGNLAFSKPGKYLVPITIYDLTLDNCSQSQTLTIEIEVKEAPVTDYAITGAICKEGTVKLSEVKQTDWTAVEWQWLNGETVLSENVSFDWRVPDAPTADITLQAVNGLDGCVATVTKTLNIEALPVAEIITDMAKENLCVTNEVALTVKTADAIKTYTWTIAGVSYNGEKQLITFSSAGVKNISLEILGENGCKQTIDSSINVVDNPVAGFTVASAGLCQNGEIAFTNASTTSTGALTYNWTLAAGVNSNEENPKHVFSTAGTKQVTLKIASADGCTDEIVKAIEVSALPDLEIVTAKPDYCMNDKVALSLTSAGKIVSAAWILPDGSTSGNLAIEWQNNNSATAIFKASVTDDNGCKSAEESLTINYHEVAAFNIAANSNAAICSGTNAQFEVTDNAPLKNYKWLIDSHTFTTATAGYTFATAGNYNITVEVEDNYGCTASKTESFTVAKPPVADFSWSNSIACTFNEINFVNNSTDAVSNSWQFGLSGTANTEVNPKYIFETTGSRNIVLTVTAANGCKNTVTKAILIVEAPVLTVNNNKTTYCQGDDIILSALSTSSLVGINWRLPDASASTGTSVNWNNAKAGNLQFEVMATDDKGCHTAPVKHTVTVNALPFVDAGNDMLVPTLTSIKLNGRTNAGNDASISWSPIINLDNPSVLTPTLYVEDSVKYILTVADANGCIAKDSVYINAIKGSEYIPNAFSPNNDGINDTWWVPAVLLNPKMTVTVFNRWGNVCTTLHYGKLKWDGTINGKPAPSGTYYYVAQDEHKKISGSITLLR